MIDAAYNAIANNAGILTVDDYSVLAIAGRHRQRWLHAMITQDVKTLQPGSSRYGCLVSKKGKVITDFQLFHDTSAESYLLIMQAAKITPVVEHLNKLIITENIVFTDWQTSHTLVTLQGPNAAKLLGNPSSELVNLTIDSADVLVAEHNRCGQSGYDLIIKNEDTDTVTSALIEQGAEPTTSDALEAHRIHAAIPKLGLDFGEKTIPQEACLMDALHWNKGCYVGQEVIARLQHRGHTNKELRQLTIEGTQIPALNAAIYPHGNTEKSVGHVTSASKSKDNNGVVALGYVRRAHFEPNTMLTIDIDGELVDAHVSAKQIRAHVQPGE